MNQSMGSWNNDINSIELSPYDATDAGAITVFEH
jgi:hypothetical protein